MERIPASERTRERLKALMGGEGEAGDGRSELVRLAARLIIEEALEGEAEDALGRGYYARGAAPGAGHRNGYRTGRLKSAEGSIEYSAPQIAERAEPFRSRLRETLRGRTEELEGLAVEMYARGLSTRDIEALFADETGKSLLSRSAVSTITERLWAEYEGFATDGWKDVLEPVVTRYRDKVSRLYFRADAAFANPDVYEFLEAERIKYAIRLPANRILQDRIGYLLKRPVGRPPIEVRRFHANFHYQAASWKIPRRVIAKVEWHPGELVPRIGFVVTNLSRLAERVVAFYNQRGTAEQWIKEGKNAINWTRLSCRSFAANAVRLQLHALAYNLGNFLRTLATPEPIKDWSLTSLKEKLIKIGAKLVSHGRYVAFQMAEVAIPRSLFAEILQLIAELRPPLNPAPA